VTPPASNSTSPDTICLLTRADVLACLADVDPVAVVEDALRLHARGQTVLPAEAYLPWENSRSAYCRSLAMPGALGTGPDGVIGLKVINAAVSNPESGLARAGGFTALFDYETGRPRVLAEGALISALRTAAYTIASLRHLGPAEFTTVAFIGCGNLGLVHADLLRRYFPEVRDLRLFDLRPQAARNLEQKWTADGNRKATVCTSVPEALAGAEVVITLTTVSEPYIESDWLDERAFIAHVSLDDIRAEVFAGAAAIYVDDVSLVEDNPRRILGALLGDRAAPSITGTLGEVLCGALEAVRPTDGRVVSNPFGMSILDLALLQRVTQVAQANSAGFLIDLTTDTPAATAWPAAEH
jgi:ornithine cyclodeaminase/alanine dehydrogenase-like protein (mu-crystallin family)